MTLALYVARRFALAFAGVLAVFWAIMFMVDVVEQIRRLDSGGGLGAAAWLAALNVPAALYRILPLVVMLATVTLFLALARSSELVVMRAAGRSALRTLLAPVVTTFLIGVLAVALLNPVVAATSKRYEVLSARLKEGVGSVLSVSREGLFLRQSGPEGQSVIRAARANLDGSQLYDVTFLSFGAETGPQTRLEAASATLNRGAWDLVEVKEWPLDSDNPERDARTHDSLSVPSDLTTDRIRDSFGAPSSIPIWDLPGFIRGLEEAGFSARRHRVWLQMELALPLFLSAMVLVGAGFTMRHARFGRTGIMVLTAMGAGFAIFFLRNFAQVLGENGQIPVALAAWSPPVAAMLLALGLLLHLEDG
ncbi:LPS export ABC transporter permease LptG [Frigidibacter oleivorans]|uniref:LPS export ABC transporter permease LptG n=1 Tax=Frigidibacter oleivorans TaxID=2487129 RepID=UPI000F8F087C|nr:LPS export ABC transporter permease LptG [Frigidibacter oleivorans]